MFVNDEISGVMRILESKVKEGEKAESSLDLGHKRFNNQVD